MKPLTVTLIQTALHWQNPAANRQHLEALMADVPAGCLVLLPEMFATGFTMQPAQWAEPMEGPTVQWLAQQAVQKRVAIAGSLAISEADKYYNRLIMMLPNGQYLYYNKRHLFAFAGEDAHYTPGSNRLIASLNGWRLNMQVCYDLRFPVWARQSPGLEQPEYDVLMYVANWPERRSHAWRTLLQARAIENQCYVMGVNRIGPDGQGITHRGDSMIVDPLGEIVWEAPPYQEAVFTYTLPFATLQEVRTKLPFLKDADNFRLLA